MPAIGILGCRSTTRYLWTELRAQLPIAALITISPSLAESQRVADYDDLSDIGKANPKSAFYVAKSYNLSAAEDRSFFQQAELDLLFVMGWQRIIPASILDGLRIGAFGMHGSSRNLPSGRGRSPMNWSIIEGRQWFFTNLFKYLPGIDDGPVVDTACFSIRDSDTAESLHFKNSLAMVDLIRRNIDDLLSGTANLIPQAARQATYYPKREPSDSIIDWTWGVIEIDRHIRAVSPPFSGAFSFANEARVVIDRASVLYTDLEQHPFRQAQPGLVCAVMPNGKFCVRAVGGVLLVHEHRIEGNATIERGTQLNSPGESIRHFPRNELGFHDLPPESSTGTGAVAAKP